MDLDNDGIIIKQDIDFELLGQEMSEMLYPLFEEIQKGEQITKKDFIEACHNLFEAFHIPQRNLSILKFNQPHIISEEEKLLKNISKNLFEIEKKYLNDENHKGIWDRLYNQRIGKTEKTKQIEIQKIFNQMRECTFAPTRSIHQRRLFNHTPTIKRELKKIIQD